jgi:hypothetical protein
MGRLPAQRNVAGGAQRFVQAAGSPQGCTAHAMFNSHTNQNRYEHEHGPDAPLVSVGYFQARGVERVEAVSALVAR